MGLTLTDRHKNFHSNALRRVRLRTFSDSVYCNILRWWNRHHICDSTRMGRILEFLPCGFDAFCNQGHNSWYKFVDVYVGKSYTETLGWSHSQQNRRVSQYIRPELARNLHIHTSSPLRYSANLVDNDVHLHRTRWLRNLRASSKFGFSIQQTLAAAWWSHNLVFCQANLAGPVHSLQVQHWLGNYKNRISRLVQRGHIVRRS